MFACDTIFRMFIHFRHWVSYMRFMWVSVSLWLLLCLMLISRVVSGEDQLRLDLKCGQKTKWRAKVEVVFWLYLVFKFFNEIIGFLAAKVIKILIKFCYNYIYIWVFIGTWLFSWVFKKKKCDTIFRWFINCWLWVSYMRLVGAFVCLMLISRVASDEDQLRLDFKCGQKTKWGVKVEVVFWLCLVFKFSIRL